MAVVTIELEMEIDKDLGVITLPEVIDYLENLIENNCLDFTVRTGDNDETDQTPAKSITSKVDLRRSK